MSLSESTIRRQRIILATATLVIAATRLLALSRAPWDWDEVQFCLGVRDFDVARHQPHPPGFPLFIMLARLVRPVAGSEFSALQVVVFVAAVALFPLFYRVARAFRFDFRSALGAAAVFALLPNVWYYGGTAFSDIPALALYLVAIGSYVAYVGERRDAGMYIAGSICLGAALLIRPHAFLIVVFPWTVATVRMVRARQLRALAAGVAATIAIVAAGYGAAMYATGPGAYIGAVRGHSAHLVSSDSMENAGRPSLGTIVRMQLDPYDAGKVSILLNVFALAGLLVGRRRVVTEILLTFAPYFVFAMLTANYTGLSRLSLAYIGAIVLLAAEGVVTTTAFVPRIARVAQTAVVATVVGRLVWWMLPALDTAGRTIPPPVEAVLWIRDRVDASAPVFVHGSMGPWPRYYLPRQQFIALDDGALGEATKDAPEGYVLAEGVTQNIYAKEFLRPRHRLWNIVPRRYFEVSLQRASETVRFGDGWYGVEGAPGSLWRWAASQSTMEMAAFDGRGELRLRYELPLQELGGRTAVTFIQNGRIVQVLTATEKRNEIRIILDSRRGMPNSLRIVVSDSFRPPGDSRALALRLIAYGWRRL